MTFWIMPEFDRQGRASARTGSGATIIRLPTDKEKTSPIRSLGGSSRTHPASLPKKGEPWRGDVGPRANKIYSN